MEGRRDKKKPKEGDKTHGRVDQQSSSSSRPNRTAVEAEKQSHGLSHLCWWRSDVSAVLGRWWRRKSREIPGDAKIVGSRRKDGFDGEVGLVETEEGGVPRSDSK